MQKHFELTTSIISPIRPHILQIIKVAQRLVKLHWAKKNAGNFSIRIKGHILTKITGATMKTIASNPLPFICLVKPAKTGTGYTVLPEGVRPTEEISAHIIGQRTLLRYRKKEKALLHTHPANLVRITEIVTNPVQLQKQLSRQSIPLSVIPPLPPGSMELAVHTGKELRKHRAVVWARHGIIASGETLTRALRTIEQIDRAAQRTLKSINGEK